MSSVIINGEIKDHVNIYDRGFQYGDGLFETIAVRNNRLLMWPQHIDRLSKGCETLGMPVINELFWLEDIRALTIKDSDCVIKLIISRGMGGRGYRPPTICSNTRIVSLHEFPIYPEHYYTHGIKAIFCNTPVSINTSLAGVKHLNRLENVLARNEWHDDSIYEGLMLNDDAHVIEGTMSNVFAVSNNILYTPLLNKSGVKGVVRDAVIKLAEDQGIEIKQITLTKELLLNMDELFITNSLIGICPVTQLDNMSFKLGEITSLFMHKFDMTTEAQQI